MRILLTAALAISLAACASTEDKRSEQSMSKSMEMSEACDAQGFVVFFNTGSAALDPAAIVELDRIGAAYRLCNVYQMEVQGFADSVGNSQANQRLSDKRATNVYDALIARGVLPNRSRIVPWGEDTIGDVEAPDAFERRVVVQLLP